MGGRAQPAQPLVGVGVRRHDQRMAAGHRSLLRVRGQEGLDQLPLVAGGAAADLEAVGAQRELDRAPRAARQPRLQRARDCPTAARPSVTTNEPSAATSIAREPGGGARRTPARPTRRRARARTRAKDRPPRPRALGRRRPARDRDPDEAPPPAHALRDQSGESSPREHAAPRSAPVADPPPGTQSAVPPSGGGWVGRHASARQPCLRPCESPYG